MSKLENAIKDYQEGVAISEINYNIPELYKEINKRGIEKRGRRKVRVCDHDAICEDYEKTRLSLRALGEKYGVSYERIRQIVNMRGIRNPERQTNLTEENKEIIDRWNGKIPLTQMSKRTEVSVSCIRNYLGDRYVPCDLKGWTGNKCRYTLVEKQAMRVGYENGSTCAEIAKRWKCAPMTAHRILKEMGTEMRSPGPTSK